MPPLQFSGQQLSTAEYRPKIWGVVTLQRVRFLLGFFVTINSQIRQIHSSKHKHWNRDFFEIYNAAPFQVLQLFLTKNSAGTSRFFQYGPSGLTSEFLPDELIWDMNQKWQNSVLYYLELIITFRFSWNLIILLGILKGSSELPLPSKRSKTKIECQIFKVGYIPGYIPKLKSM